MRLWTENDRRHDDADDDDCCVDSCWTNAIVAIANGFAVAAVAAVGGSAPAE